MKIEDLYGRHKGEPIYIVGTGPSMRLFPLEFLRDKVCIGLNQAWRYCPLTYTISVHPELLIDYQREKHPHKTQWIVKHKPPLNLELDDPNYYVFWTQKEDYTIFAKPQLHTLFIGNGVQQTAMHMAFLMEASAIFLVGVDMAELGGDHHAHDQHVRFHGLTPQAVYAEYREKTAAVRVAMQKVRNVPILNISPLLGADSGNEEYLRQCVEKGLAPLPAPKDTSPYMRLPHVKK